MTQKPTLLDTLEQFEIPQEVFCNIACISRDDLFAISEERSLPHHRAEAIIRLMRGAGVHKTRRAISAMMETAPVREWRTIPGFPAYEASDDGFIRRAISSQRGAVRVLRTKDRGDGYARVTLYGDNGKPQRHQVHRIVCLTFHGEAPLGRAYACHQNGEKHDNRASNLYWGSALDNSRDWQIHRRQKIASAVQTPYKLLTNNEIREGVLSKKLNRTKGMDELKRRARSR